MHAHGSRVSSSLITWRRSSQRKSRYVSRVKAVPSLTSSQQADNTRTRMTAEYFVNELARSGTRTYVLAAATSAMDCHPLLRTKHVFGKTIDVKAPSSDVRRQILGKILSSRHRVDAAALDLTTIAHEAEGYMAADLNDLVENAMQQLLVRQMTGDTVRMVRLAMVCC